MLPNYWLTIVFCLGLFGKALGRLKTPQILAPPPWYKMAPAPLSFVVEAVLRVAYASLLSVSRVFVF